VVHLCRTCCLACDVWQPARPNDSAAIIRALDDRLIRSSSIRAPTTPKTCSLWDGGYLSCLEPKASGSL
jgi:hypothetical protein